MTNVFLGYPPEHIKNWIIEHSQANPPAGVERWVEPIYTNKAIGNDGSEYTLVELQPFSEENEAPMPAIKCVETGVLITGPNLASLAEFPGTLIGDVEMYLKYTPGHWEDANGNWINGNWGEWNTNFSSNDIMFMSMEELYGYGDNEKNWWISIDGGGDIMAVAYPSATNKNVTTIWQGGFIATRTWNNTKSAPAA